EFLLASAWCVVVGEVGGRDCGVETRNAAGLIRVVLPEGAANAWDVMRELEVSFPGPTFGLNAIYRPPITNAYRPQDGAGPTGTGAGPSRHELLSLIGWEGKGDLAACAA